MSIKAIVYDADGVIINSEMFSVQLSKDYGISNDKLLPFFKGRFKECILGKADLKEELSKVIKDWGWEKSVDEIMEYWFNAENHVDPEIIESIRLLRNKGSICCLATNQEKYRVQFMKDKMKFNDYFDTVYFSAEVGHRKPEKEFYYYMINDLKVEPNEILYFDDDQENIEVASGLGIQAYLFNGIENYKEVIKQFI